MAGPKEVVNKAQCYSHWTLRPWVGPWAALGLAVGRRGHGASGEVKESLRLHSAGLGLGRPPSPPTTQISRARRVATCEGRETWGSVRAPEGGGALWFRGPAPWGGWWGAGTEHCAQHRGISALRAALRSLGLRMWTYALRRRATCNTAPKEMSPWIAVFRTSTHEPWDRGRLSQSIWAPVPAPRLTSCEHLGPKPL